MRVRRYTSQKKEFVFGIVASALAIALLVYLFFLVRSISRKGSEAFGSLKDVETGVTHFNFVKYDELTKRVKLAPPASSTTSSSTKL